MQKKALESNAFCQKSNTLHSFKFLRILTIKKPKECEPYVFAYQDDVIIATETFEKHLYWLAYVLKRLKEAWLTVNRQKCEFGCSQVRYLGYVLDHRGLRPDKGKIATVVNYPPPANLKQLRRFLGMVAGMLALYPTRLM